MAIRQLAFSSGLLIFLATAVCAQEEPLTLVCDQRPNCGSKIELPAETVTCRMTQETNGIAHTFRHNDLRIAMIPLWRRNELRVRLTLENTGKQSVPINLKLWTLTAYKSVEDFQANKRLFTSRAKQPPIRVQNGLLNTSTSDLPSNAPVTREVTTRPTTNQATGQILNANTKMMSSTRGGPPPNYSEVASPGSSAPPSASKWTELPPGSTELGEVSFSINSNAKYATVSFDINGTVYIYTVAR